MEPEPQIRGGIYERLVKGEDDILGQIAYSIYKKRKWEFVVRKKAELDRDVIPSDLMEEFIKDQTDYTLELYKTQAEKLSRDFLDASYGVQFAHEAEELRKEYQQRYDDLVKAIRPRSWWYGFLQSFFASLFFVLAGYIILKMSGSWEMLLNKLFE